MIDPKAYRPTGKTRQFFSFVKKECFHIYRDKRTMFILLGMPLVQILLFGFALTNEVKNSKIAILDNSKDAATTSLVTQIEASRYFQIEDHLDSYTEIESRFQAGEIKLVVVLPPNFKQDLQHLNTAQIQLIADASDPNMANTLTNYATAVIMDYENRLTHERKIPYAIHVETRMLYNPQLKGAYTFVPGVIAMVLMLVCTMMTAITIVREKETGTMEVLLASPVTPMIIIIAKAIPYLMLSLINVITILLLSVFVLDVPINGSLFLLLSESVLFTITCLALGLLISSSTDSQQTAMFISLVAMFLPTVMLSGFLFPIENMPAPLQYLSNLVPAKWFYTIARSVMIKGVGLAVIWKESLILIGMTLIFVLLIRRNFKIRLA